MVCNLPNRFRIGEQPCVVTAKCPVNPTKFLGLNTAYLKTVLTSESSLGGLSVLEEESTLQQEDPGNQAQVLDALLGLYSAGNHVSVLVSWRSALLVKMQAAAAARQVHPATLEVPSMEEGSPPVVLHHMNNLRQTKSPIRKLSPTCQRQQDRKVPRRQDLQRLHRQRELVQRLHR